MNWYYVLAVYLIGVTYGMGRHLYDVIQYKRKPYVFHKFIPTTWFCFNIALVMSVLWPVVAIALLMVNLSR